MLPQKLYTSKEGPEKFIILVVISTLDSQNQSEIKVKFKCTVLFFETETHKQENFCIKMDPIISTFTFFLLLMLLLCGKLSNVIQFKNL